MLEENKKSYYAVIPASVRYDNRICPNAKLLYGEITALCNEKGYCWALNQYFAELYDVTKVSISRWISSLENAGYIKIELIYDKDSKEIKGRHIHIVDNKEVISTPTNNEPTENKKVEKFKDEIKEIIDYLNEKTGSHYRYSTEGTNKIIRGKLNDGFSVDDFKSVIDKKVADWQNTDFEKYLRPTTLFGNKFEQYLNQKPTVKKFNPIHTISQKFSQNTSTSKDDVLKDKDGNTVIF